MARPPKLFLTIIGLGLLIVISALIAAVVLFDPNDFRGQIAESVKKETGRDITLGNIELSVFPWLRIELTDVKLSNAPGFGAEPFAAISEAAVGVKLFPLLFDKKIEASTVTLTGLRLNLAKNASGNSNWADLLDKQKEEKKPEPETKGETNFKLEDINIGGITIKDSSVAYRDAQSKQAYRIEKLELETGSIKPGDPFDIDASLIAISEAQKLNAALEFSAHLVPDLKAQKVAIEDLKLDVKTQGEGLAADLKLSGEVLADLSAKLYQIAGLTLVVDASGKAVPGGKQQLKMIGNLSFDQARGAMKFSKGQLQAAGLDISAEITGDNMMGDAPRLQGPITIQPFNPKELLIKLGQPPIKTTDPEALKSLSLSGRYSGSFKSARLENVQLKLDQTTASGSLGIRSFATQAMEFALKLDQIDADRYLAPAVAETEASKAAAAKIDTNAIELPTELLEKLNASGTLDIGTLKLKKLTMKDVRLKFDGPKGSAKLVDLGAKLYGGQINTSSRIAPGARPSYNVKSQINAITLGPMLSDFVGKDYVTGLGAINFDLSSAGKTVGAAKQALNGDLSLSFQNGAVKGFNLGQIIRQGQALLRGQPAPAKEPQETDFAAITFAAKIINGVLKSDQLNALSPLFRVSGEGEIDLVRETINYLAKPTVVDTGKGQGGKGLEDLNGVMIPIRLSGNLFAPKYKIDFENALRQKATEKVREQLKEKEVEIKQKLGDALGKFLSGKQKKQPEPEPAPTTEPAP